MNTEKQVSKILMNLNPNARTCLRCKRLYDISMVFPISSLMRHCLMCCVDWGDIEINKKILSEGKEFLEKMFFHQYNIEIVNTDPRNITCTVTKTLE